MDAETPLLDLTVKDFLTLMEHGTARRIQQDAKEEQELTLRIFKDVAGIQAVATPFRIEDLDGLKRFTESVANAIRGKTGTSVVIAMAVVKDGEYKPL